LANQHCQPGSLGQAGEREGCVRVPVVTGAGPSVLEAQQVVQILEAHKSLRNWTWQHWDSACLRKPYQ